eukprot:scaffold177407_cov18-Prasinocladus_malaysianus.AAC.1
MMTQSLYFDCFVQSVTNAARSQMIPKIKRYERKLPAWEYLAAAKCASISHNPSLIKEIIRAIYQAMPSVNFTS